MSYFSIQNSHNRKIIGKYPQTKDINYNCHVWDDPKFVEHIHFEKVDFEPITANAILDSRAKQTDLINANGAMGFSTKLLISGKLKSILEKNRQTGLQFFKSPIIQNNSIIDDYWVLNMYEFNYEDIDFEKSEVIVGVKKNGGGTEKVEKRANNFIEFMKIIDFHREKLESVSIFKIFLIDNIKYDFFALKYVFGAMYFVSEKLKKEIEDAGCTGIEFQPLELSYNEWTMPGGVREKVYGKM